MLPFFVVALVCNSSRRAIARPSPTSNFFNDKGKSNRLSINLHCAIPTGPASPMVSPRFRRRKSRMVRASFILARHSKSPAIGFPLPYVGWSTTEEVSSGTSPPPYLKDSSGSGPPYISKRIQAASALPLLSVLVLSGSILDPPSNKSDRGFPPVFLAGYCRGGLNGNIPPPPYKFKIEVASPFLHCIQAT
jgi:hypothetical protein